MKLTHYVKLEAGKPVSRFVDEPDATTYPFYLQSNFDDDLVGMNHQNAENRFLHTSKEDVSLTKAGDILFNLMTGQASLVSPSHTGYYFSQNYVRLTIKKELDPKFLVYLLNENHQVRRSLIASLQGSQVIKFTVRALREVILPKLPKLTKQQLIGQIYFDQLRITALKKRQAENQKIKRMNELKEAVDYA